MNRIRKTQVHKHLYMLLVVLGILSICAISCTPCEGAQLGEACEKDDDCCTSHCGDEGVCCTNEDHILLEDETSAVCCSGRTRMGDSGPRCCSDDWDLRVADSSRCCTGLEFELDARGGGGYCRDLCPDGCYYEPDALRLDVECVCPGEGIEPPGWTDCEVCYDIDDPNCWVYRVYHEGYFDPQDINKRCIVFVFYASTEKVAEDCAVDLADAAGLSLDWPWVVEWYQDLGGCEK